MKHACLAPLHHIPSAMNIAIVASYYSCTCGSNGYVQEKRTIMMDDVFIYHAHTFFVLLCACVAYLDFTSTSTSRELTIRALESEPHTFDHDSLLHHLSYNFGNVKNACLTPLHHIPSAMNIAIVASYYSCTCASNGAREENHHDG